MSDNFEERIEQKIFHCEIVVNNERVAAEAKSYCQMPIVADFTDADGNNVMKLTIQENYNRIKSDVKQIVERELQRIAADPELSKLLDKKK